MYLILNGDLKDFGREEIEIIANIARYHRKSPPKRKHKAYADLGPAARHVVDVGAALLRIADGLDRSHGQVITGLRCKLESDEVTIRVATRADAELEIWGARRKREWFEKVFGRKLKFEVK
jgi:exopolyphosphatase/guanosine-5'-triphosphate,3'-diphosphate pyrophosphatase